MSRCACVHAFVGLSRFLLVCVRNVEVKLLVFQKYSEFLVVVGGLRGWSWLAGNFSSPPCGL